MFSGIGVSDSFFKFNLGILCLAKATTITGTWLNLEFEKPEKTYGIVVLFLKTSTCLKSKLIFLSWGSQQPLLCMQGLAVEEALEVGNTDFSKYHNCTVCSREIALILNFDPGFWRNRKESRSRKSPIATLWLVLLK